MENLLKNKLESGKTVFGTFSWTASTMVTECLGYTGLDYVIIDAEHSPIDTEGAVNMVRSAKVHGLTPIIRAKDCTRPSILKMLDLGAEGVIVPNLHTVDEVKAVVDFGKYTPVGRRGFAQGRRAGFGFEPDAVDLDEYLRASNELTLLLPMCETVDMLEHIEEAAAVDGVDGIYVGPFDLSLDMGIPGRFDRPEFQAALKRIEAACRAAGKYSFIFSSTPETAIAHVKLGYQAPTLGIDANMIVRSYRDALAHVKESI